MPSDPFFSSVSALLHCDGTNGSTTIIDSGPSARACAALSSAAISTVQSKFGGASALFPAATSNSGITIGGAVAGFQFGAGKFTVEGWANYLGSGISGIASQWAGGGSNLGWFFGTVGGLSFFYSTTGSDQPSLTGTFSPTVGTWYHLAVDRDASNVLRLYVNGVVVASATVAATIFASTLTPMVGNDTGLGHQQIGYLDDIRITKGVARYAGAFTPPTAPFPDIATQAELNIPANVGQLYPRGGATL